MIAPALEMIIGAAPMASIDALCGTSTTETGGVLVGRYDGDCVLVGEALAPPPDSVHGPTDFVRGTDGLAAALDLRWPAAYYVGDWHYHPAAVVEPSAQDFAAMRAIAADRAAQCPCPVMVIVGRRGATGRPMRAWAFPSGEPVEIAARSRS